MTQYAAPSAAAVAARRAMKKSFQTRGILTAVSSGMVYGMYTAFMTYAMAMGIWAVWYGENSGLSEFATQKVAFSCSLCPQAAPWAPASLTAARPSGRSSWRPCAANWAISGAASRRAPA